MSKQDKTTFSLIKKIEDEEFFPCYICLELTGVIRLTNRYCNNCYGYFCNEHGSFRGKGKTQGYCLMHDSRLVKIAEENINSKG